MTRLTLCWRLTVTPIITIFKSEDGLTLCRKRVLNVTQTLQNHTWNFWTIQTTNYSIYCDYYVHISPIFISPYKPPPYYSVIHSFNNLCNFPHCCIDCHWSGSSWNNTRRDELTWIIITTTHNMNLCVHKCLDLFFFLYLTILIIVLQLVQ